MGEQNIRDPRTEGTKGLRSNLSHPLVEATRGGSQGVLGAIRYGLATGSPVQYLGDNPKYQEVGKSSYDSNAETFSQLSDINDFRGQQQPWYIQIGAGVAKGAVLAGTTFANGTIGLVWGLGTAIGEGRWSGIWDNDFTRAMDAVENYMENEAMPNYYTNDELNNAWYQNILSSNFIGDKFIKNLGFTVGSAYGGGLWSKGATTLLSKTLSMASNASKAPSAIAKVVGATTAALGEGSKEALSAANEWYEPQAKEREERYKKEVEDIEKEFQSSKSIEEQKRDLWNNKYKDIYDQINKEYEEAIKQQPISMPQRGEGLTSPSNPAYEAYQQKLSALREAMHQEVSQLHTNNISSREALSIREARLKAAEDSYKEDLAKLNEDRGKLGNRVLMANLPLLTATDYFTFGRYYARGYKTARHTGNEIRRTAEGYTNKTVSNARLAANNFMREGGEEGAQFGISFASKDYYNTDIENYYRKKEDPDAELLTQSWINSSIKAVEETITNPESQEQIFIGGVTGLLGAPMIGRKDGKLKFFMSGGVWDQIKERSEIEKRTQEIVDYLNSRTVDKKEFMNYYHGLNGHNFYQMQMDDAEERGDEFEFKNAEHNQFVNDVAIFDNAGKMQDFFTLLEEIHDTSDENLISIIETTSSIVGDKVVGPYAEFAKIEDGKVVANFGNAESKQKMIDTLNKNKEELVKKAKEYLKIKEALDIRTGERLTDDQLTELTWMQSNIKNWEERGSQVAGDVQNYIKSIISGYNQIIQDQEAIYNSSVSTAKKDENGKADYTITEDEQKLFDEIQENKKIRTFFERLNNMSPAALASIMGNNPEMVEELKKALDDLDDSMIEQYAIDKDKTKQSIDDIVKLNTAKKRFDEKLVEYLAHPERMEEDAAQVKDEIDKNNKAKDKLNTIEKIRNSSIHDLVNDESVNTDDIRDGLGGEFEDIAAALDEIDGVRETKPQVRQAIQTTTADEEDPGMNDMLKDMAVAALDRAYGVSDSTDQLLDFDSEAWSNPQGLPIDESIDPNEIDEVMSELKNFMEKVKDKVLEAKKVIGKTPSQTPVQETPTDDKAHDSGTSVDSENDRASRRDEVARRQEEEEKAKRAFLAKIEEIVQNFSPIIQDAFRGEANKVLSTLEFIRKNNLGLNVLTESETYTNIPEDFKAYINEAINAYRQALSESLISTTTEEETPEEEEVIEEEDLGPRGEPTPDTPDDNSLLRVTQTGDTSADTTSSGPRMYWRTSTSRLPSKFLRGEHTPYYQLLINKLSEEEKQKLPPDIRRMKAVWDYLNAHGAFDNVDGDKVKPMMKVWFKIDEKLNEAAGVDNDHPIILILDNQGNLIGDMVHEFEKSFKTYAGLSNLVEAIKKAHKEGQLEEEGKLKGVVKGISTTIDKNMEGKVPYSNDTRTLNEIANGEPLLLGLAMTTGEDPKMMAEGGRTKATRGGLDNRLLRPLKAKAGQPFMLIGTSKRNTNGQTMYRPVRINMPTYTGQGNTRLDQMIMQTFSLIFNSSINELAIKDRLLDLLALKDCWIERVPQGDEIRVRLELQNGKQLRRVLKPIDNPQQVRSEVLRLINDMLNVGPVAYQVSRRYINGKIDGLDYNSLIGEIARCNLPVGTNHTLSDWFTLKLTEGKTQSPKTTGVNPNAKMPRHNQDMSSPFEVGIDYNGHAYMVFLDDWSVRGDEGELYNQDDVDANLLRAYAFGIVNNLLGTNKPYNTNWGYYDPTTHKFTQAPKQQGTSAENQLAGLGEDFDGIADALDSIVNGTGSSNSQETQPTPSNDEGVESSEETTEESPQVEGPSPTEDLPVGDFEGIASALEEIQGQPSTTSSDDKEDNRTSEECYEVVEDLLDADSEEMWKTLSIQSQRALATLAENNEFLFNRKIEALSKAFIRGQIDLSKLGGAPSVEDFINPPKMRIQRGKTSGTWNKDKEIAWLRKVLPNLSTPELLRIHKGLIKVANSSEEAYGRFWNGVITIANNAASGTLFHEAFHSVVNTLLSNEEYKALFSEARNKWKGINDFDLEENLAEDFRRYVQREEIPILGKFVKLYHSLKNAVTSMLGKRRYIDKLFYDICRGRYADVSINHRVNSTPRYSVSEDRAFQEGQIKELSKKTDFMSLKKSLIARRKKAIDTYGTKRITLNGRVHYFLNMDFSFNSESAIKEAINRLGLSDFAYAGIDSRNGQWEIFLSPVSEINTVAKYLYNLKEKERKLRLDEHKDMLNKINRYQERRLSEEQLEEQEYRDNEQWEIDRYFAYQYWNLSPERLKVLEESGISEREYEEMDIEEKDRFFLCRGLGY